MSFPRVQEATYESSYGFREAPFSLTPDPRFVYSSPSHERALETIVHALGRREGLIVVTGDIGCGKTTLCRRLLPRLPPSTFLSLVLNPFLAADDLLKQVLEDYGLVSGADIRGGALSHASCHTLARTLQEFLNSLTRMNGTAVIIVDEAQNLPLRTLEQIRLLSNFETDTSKLLQIILVGQRNLTPILELEEMRQLNQRISRRCHIEPLSASEVGAYVSCRLDAAMPDGEPARVHFTPGALAAVSRLSGGVPRIINLLCDRTLELESVHWSGGESIDRGRVLSAAKDLDLPIPSALRFTPIPFRPTLKGAAAAGAVAAAALIATNVPWGTWMSALRPTARAESPRSEAIGPAAIKATDVQPALPPAAPGDTQAVNEPPPPRTVVQTAASYELTVASYRTAGVASAEANKLVDRGHPARVATSGGWNLVVVGPYTSLPEAETAKETLTKSGFSGIRIARSP